jgi:hypothetical protein
MTINHILSLIPFSYVATLCETSPLYNRQTESSHKVLTAFDPAVIAGIIPIQEGRDSL